MSISRYGWLLTPVLCCVMAATPAHETPSGDLERNRQLLQKWKTDPDHYARLQRDLRDYWALPPAKRERLRLLDKELHQLDAKTQKHLWKVMDRYSVWLEQLPEDERRNIETATDPQERLRRIKEIHERQWIEGLPRKMAEELAKLPAEQRAARGLQLREQERHQRRLWQQPLGSGSRALKHPTRLREFPKEVQDFVEKHLLPHLNAEEQRRYRQAEGRPEFSPTLKHLADQHPVLPPLPAPRHAVTHYEVLPGKAKEIAGAKTLWERRVDEWRKLREVEGKWPEWAETFVRLLTEEQRKAMPPLGASRPREFPAAIQTFITTTLRERVKLGEFRKLQKAEGKWPDYPRHLLKLAHDHNLHVPGMSLPGPAELWEDVRKK
ncbi:MAG TPA: hypothetical protein VN688_24900 [Gemmataceae bacterium]|nr:hypothetical protein [Gemmataceae bacterium]